MNIKPPEIIESVSELKRLIRKFPYGFQKQRITMLYLYRSGQVKTRKDASEMIGVHRKTIGTWLSTYVSEGLDGLLKRSGSFAKMRQDLVYYLFHLVVLRCRVLNQLLRLIILLRVSIYMVL